MFFLEKEYLLWTIILIVSDFIVVNCFCKIENSSLLEKKIINFFASTALFIPFRVIWIYRNFKYIGYFYEVNPDQTLKVGITLGILAMLEFFSEIILILFYFYYFCTFIETYNEICDNASNCSLKLFLQLNKFNKIETKENSILYISSEIQEVRAWDFYEKRNIKRKIKFNPLALFIVCYIINKDNKNKNKNSKIKKQKEIDEKFYKMVISDLEKIKNENLEKSNEYFEQVKYE